MSNDLGMDRSGNGNNWTVNNITYADQMVDSPTNNFATLNPLGGLQTSTITFSEGNLKASNAAGGTEPIASSTIAMTSGKWYFEYRNLSGNGSVGIQDTNNAGQSYIYHDNQGGFGSGYYYNGSLRATDGQDANYGAAWGNTDIIGVALDVDNGTLVFYKNNASQGTAETGLPSSASLGYRFVISTDAATAMANFGQDSSFAGNSTAQGNQDGNGIGDFYYTPPTGFLALCTSNLPDVAVVPSENFNTVLFTGNGSTQTVTGTGFQPDWVWNKSRNTTHGHALFDAVRGGTRRLASESTQEERTNEGNIAFTSDGFNVTASHPTVNNNNSPMVSWNWKAGNATLGTGDFTQGSTASTCSRNVDAGFSIVSYTGNGSAGATIGHGLNSIPEMIFLKSRTSSIAWGGQNATTGATKNLFLNQTDAAESNILYWNNTAPTTNVFSLGASHVVNKSSDNYIAYCFHSVDGYSKVGTYSGNGNADGTFVYTGFRPAFVLCKRTDGGDSWIILDSTRDTYNVANHSLWPNLSDAEGQVANKQIDIVSNGFKHRQTSNQLNGANNYIYLAFAETPFKYSNAR